MKLIRSGISTDIIEYFSFLTGLTPTESQKELLLDLINMDRKKILIAAGRQVGKTLTCAVVIFWLAFELEEEIKILLVAQGTAADPPIYTKIKEIFRRKREYFINKVIIVNKYEDLPKYGFETRKGSYVHYRNATEGQVRGVTADFVFIDEAGIIKDDVILSAFDCKSGKWSKFIVLSTPPEKPNLFTRWYHKATELKFIVHHWSELGLSWHSQDDLDFKKSEYSSQRYKREVLGQFLDADERAYFPSKHVDAIIFECPCTREGGAQSSIEIGLDFGFDPCKTVIVVTEKIFSKRKLLFIKSWHKKPIEEIAPEIGQLLTEWSPNLVKADDKPAEYQHKIESYTKVKIHYLAAPMHKEAIISQLQRRVRQHQLIIPDHFTNIILELRKYRRGKRTGDDLVDALALACYEPATPLSSKPTGTAVFSW